MTSLSTRIARALVPATVIVTLVGCANPGGGTAFSVNGTEVSTQQVDDSSRDCAKATGYQASEIKTQVAAWVLRGEIARQIESQRGITIPDKTINDAITANQGQQLDVGQCGVALRRMLNSAALEKQTGQQLAVLARPLSIKVNPVYGGFDPNSLTLGNGSGSLSYDGNGPIAIGG